MIVNGNKNSIERGGDNVVESHFKIKATGKAFKILSDGLYSDKPLAIVRELCCNAYDAHVAAGRKDEPFTVHLPNYMEPFFSVRDDGIGLSRQQVEEIFTTYFESTKTDSNDYIGALGLGSKSPFSYVDSFTVISRYNGTKYSFNAFMNEDDIPSIALLFEEETTERNGVEITMPVRSNDHSTFSQKASQVLEWFNPRPKILGQSISFPTRNFTLQGTGWKLEKQVNYWGSSAKTVAIQGKIAYPINPDSMQQDLNRLERTVMSSGFHLEFNIGDLEVSASRESLSLKKGTIAALKAKAALVIEEMPKQFQTTIDACPTLWDAKVKLGEIMNSSNVVREILGASNSITYKGLPLTTKATVIAKNYAGMQIAAHTGRNPDVQDMGTYYHNDYTFQCGVGIEFFYNDLPRGAPSRVRTYVKESATTTAYLISTEDEAQKDALLKELGDPPVKLASILPKPTAAQAGVRVSKTAIQLHVKQWGGDYRFQSIAEDDPVEVDDGGLFIALYRNVPVSGEPTETATKISEFSDLIANARALGLLTDKEVVYGVTLTAIKQIKDRPEWKNVETVLKERFDAYLTKNSLANTLAFKQSYNTWYGHNSWVGQWTNWVQASTLPMDHPVREFDKQRRKAVTLDTTVAAEMARLMGHTASMSGGVSSYDFTGQWSHFMSIYPVMKMDVRVDNQVEMNQVADYFKLVDEKLQASVPPAKMA